MNSPEMKKLLHLLQSQVGYSEHAGGSTKFGHWYNTVENDAEYTSQPWCDMFLSWGAHKLGYAHWFGQFAYTVSHARWFKQHHAWGSVPVPGAVVFFDWSGTGTIDGIDHVGIVASVDGKKIHTIEGNTGGGQVRAQVRDQSSVVGYGYPEKIRALQERKVEAEGRATAAATAHQTMSLPPATPRPAEAPAPAAAPHHLSRASQATFIGTASSAPASPTLTVETLAGSASATVRAAVAGTSPGMWTAAHSDPDAKTVSRTNSHPVSHTVPAITTYEPATTRTVADFQPLPSIPPQLGDTAVITPLLVAVLAAAYFKVRRGSVRHAVADGDAQAILESPAPSRAPGHGTSGEPGGWFTPVRMNTVADRADRPGPPPWPSMPVDRPGTAFPPPKSHPADVFPGHASPADGDSANGDSANGDSADAFPTDVFPADAYAAEAYAVASAAPPHADPLYFMPDRRPTPEQPDPSDTPEPPSHPRPSLYQGSDGLADALETFWSTNLHEEHTGGPAAPIPDGRPAPTGPSVPVEQRASADENRPAVWEEPRARWATDRSPAASEQPPPEERPKPEKQPAPQRRTKGGRHRKS
ncbi:hypothetical protein GCM10023194_14110 [Planotetraspora phitsanulokensis]|uniref:Peptidase C51 domain-containing protein n=1 Tax=Planotetraspora phitsanulokensis TaxID=575192 RepID=A0A8J3XGE8_9ACTN|nr:CHAP domain-containing protein [Planotetraspora phitsanulokensis]GII38976.1 hypothetical protein Pph01_39790 [Planotetraspora phitsanulokensis]